MNAPSANCWTGRLRRLGDGAVPSRQALHGPGRSRPRPICASCWRFPPITPCCSCKGARPSISRQIPMNLAGEGDSADYIVTGHWGEKAVSEAAPYVKVNIAASSKERALPAAAAARLRGNSIRVPPMCTTRPTKPSTASSFTTFPTVGDVPLVADMSSNILSEPLDVSRFGLIYAGAQKNIGPSGLVVMIIRRDLLQRATPTDGADLPLRRTRGERLHAQHAQYLGLVPGGADLPVAEGAGRPGGDGASAIAPRRSCCTAPSMARVATIAAPSSRPSRSRMNVPFTLHDSALDADFLKESEAAGLLALKGHKAVGGMRASLYNAVPLEAVQALVAFMRRFRANVTDETVARGSAFHGLSLVHCLDFFPSIAPRHDRQEILAYRRARAHRQYRPADPAADLRARRIGAGQWRA